MNHAMGSRTALSRSCSHKRLAFVGDSTMQEVMFTLMLEVICNGGNHACAPLDSFTLPVQHCANTRCKIASFIRSQPRIICRFEF